MRIFIVELQLITMCMLFSKLLHGHYAAGRPQQLKDADESVLLAGALRSGVMVKVLDGGTFLWGKWLI